MKVEQRNLGLCGLSQLQCEVDSDTRGSGAPLRTADRNHMPATIGGTRRQVIEQLHAQLVLHYIAREWLRKVLAQTEFHKRAVEGDICALTDQRHPDVGWADAG